MPRNVPRVPPEQVLLKLLPFACRIPLLKFGQIITFFYPTGSSAKKRKCEAATEPDSKPTPSLDSDSSSTVDTSSSEGEDVKDFILPDYPSDQRL